MNLMVSQGDWNRLYFTIERIEIVTTLEIYTQLNVTLDVTGRQVGNEVMVARGILAADGFQAVFRLHGLGLGGSIHLGHVRAIDDLGTLSLHGLDMGFHLLRHVAAAGNDEGLVAGSGGCLYSTIHHLAAHQQALGDIVAIEAGLIDVEDGLDKLRCQFAHSMDGELHEQLLGVLLPHITDGQIDQEVVVGLSPLEETLAALHILHEFGCITPDGVRGAHVDRGIELPAWPWVVLGRIASAVEEHTVHAGTKHQVEVGLKLRERCAEMLREPREGLAARERLAADMGCRRSILEHGIVGVVLAGLARVLTQTLDTEVGKSETLNLRDIHGCIAVDEIGR